MKKKVSLILILTMLVTLILSSVAQGAVLSSGSKISTGARKDVYIIDTASGESKAVVVTVDLKDEYNYLETVPGMGSWTQRATVSEMAKNTNSIVTTNGDFFNLKAEGAPIGATVIDGELVSSPSYLIGTYAFGITKEKKAYIEQFAFDGSVHNNKGQAYALSGVNKTFYWQEDDNTHSHLDKLHLYTDMWSGTSRGMDSYAGDNVAEVLIRNNKVAEVMVQGAFATGVPTGCYILHGQGRAADFLRGLSVGENLEINYHMTPDRDWQMVLGGHGLLVDKGEAVRYTKDLGALGGVRARTAVGVSEDGTKVYLVTAEGKTAQSVGLSLDDLALFMQEIGCYRAVNLDGGGSATMVVKELGETEQTRVVNPEYYANERKVVNGLALYTTAPKTNIAAGIKLNGSRIALVGEEIPYQVKAWDKYYHAVEDFSGLSFSDSNSLGEWKDHIYVAKEKGITILGAQLNDAADYLPLEIIGAEAIERIAITGLTETLEQGESVTLSAEMLLKNGQTKAVSPKLLNWSVDGHGSIDAEGVLKVIGSGAVVVRAEYDGIIAEETIIVAAANKHYPLNNLTGISSYITPAEIGGSVELAIDPESEKTVLRLSYDFSQTTQTAASYAVFEQERFKLGANVTSVAVDVYGLNNGEWLRMELVDSNGEIHRYTLCEKIDFVGWQQAKVVFDKPLSEPMELWRIYVVDASGKTRYPEMKSILLKDLTVMAKSTLGAVTLQIGEPYMNTAIGKQEMDVAPYLIQDRTMVPLRFISEAFGGEVLWDNDTRTATTICNGHTVSLTVGENTIYVDGEEHMLDVPAEIVDNRTMIPLRAVNEGLGMMVTYISEVQTIIIES